MVELTALLLPILIAGVIVFFASFVMWMVLPHHKSDWARLPDEDATIAALRQAGLRRGQYGFPHCGSNAQMKDPAWVKRFEEGPSGFLIVRRSGPMNMGKSMVIGFVYDVLVILLVAYLASIVLPAGTDYMKVFRVVSTAAFLGFSGSTAVNAIWFEQSWSSTIKHMLDGLVYALLVAGVFAWLWPAV